MDVIVFNTSSNLTDVIGGKLCRFLEGAGNVAVVSVGGLRSSHPSPGQHAKPQQSNLMHIDILDIRSACWRPEYIATSNIRNRAYHDLAVVRSSAPADAVDGLIDNNGIKESILVFGGGLVDTSLVPAGDVLAITKGLFGYKINTVFKDEQKKLAYLGLSASTVGNGDRVLVYGGTAEGKFNPSLQLYTPSTPSTPNGGLRSIEVDPACSQPPARAYHSTLVVGNQDQYLLVLGGEGEGGQMLGDIWLLDLSDVLAAEYAPPEAVVDTSKDKGKAKAKDAPKAVYARWQAIPMGFNGRSRFQALLAPLSVQEGKFSYDLTLLGGLGAQGLISLAAGVKTTITITPQAVTASAPPAKGAAPTPPVSAVVNMSEFVPLDSFPAVGSALEKKSAHISVLALQQFPAKAMAFAACPIYEADFDISHISITPLGWLLTGGFRMLPSGHAQPTVTLLAVDGKAPMVKRIKKTVQRNYILEGHPIQTDKMDREEDADKLKSKSINFNNGDVYTGQVMQIYRDLASPGPESDEIFTNGSHSIGTNDEEELDEEEGGVEGLHLPHGQGTMKYHQGDVYEGEWHEGNQSGQGKLLYANGDVYEGTFFEGSSDGEGVLTCPSGNRQYSGQFQRGFFEGVGELRSGDEIYRGHFHEGMRHGNGVISYLVDGQESGEMVGTWENDQMVGAGKATNFTVTSINLLLGYVPKDRLFLEEEQVNSVAQKRKEEALRFLPHLASRITGSYSGPMAQGQPEGDGGVCRYMSGDTYEGQLRKGRRNGMGRYTFANGDVYEGKWVGDVPCGFGRFQTLLGDGYEGQWENNAHHGQGALVNKKEGTCYVGGFAKGKKHGAGKIVDDNTQRVKEEGQYLNDRLVKV